MTKHGKILRAGQYAVAFAVLWTAQAAVAQPATTPASPALDPAPPALDSAPPSLAAVPPMRNGRTLTVTGAGRPSGPSAVRRLTLETGAGQVVSLSEPATNVFVADPKVAEVRPASANSLFVFGVGPGRTTIVVLDQAGRTISNYEVQVRASSFGASEAEAAVARVTGNRGVRVTPQTRGLLVTGTVGSAADAARTISVLRGFAPEGSLIENQLTVRDSIQVTLKVRIIEMNRSVTRALGVNFQDFQNFARTAILPGTFAQTALGLGVASSPAGAFQVGSRDVNALIQALANDNLARVLAEPNLTVMSGQSASFLAGGEFPIAVAQSAPGANGIGTISVEFKKYGVSLAFVPTVLSDGRINLHVAPEVSQLTNTGAVTTSVGNASISIPALLTRRAETTVELGTGQTFAIAGLLSDNTNINTTSVPFLGDIPILGALFRSSGYQRQETELVILVTPYIVNPVSDAAQLRTPTDNFLPPNDLERIVLLRQNGAQPASVATRIPGQAGFVVQ